MLTTENQLADPSCSSRSPPLKAHDQKVSDADPNFSIRGYAFASRSKDIRTSWPFPQKLLQLCFKHGIKDLLPPFEPPDSVRLQCQKTTADLEDGCRVVAQVGSHEITDVCSDYVVLESILPSDKVVLETGQYPSRKEEKITVDEVLDGDTELAWAVTSKDRFKGISKQITKVEFARRPSLSEKKCKLVLKLSSNSQARRIEDIASTSSTVSDPMASKVCPVCKLFSSPSNTTLNAHMDQCLSVESNDTALVVTQSTNPKVKPRKKRLMVDIYSTAPHCTLEELNRRNGTTWARDFALVAVPGGEPPTETKRPRLSPVDFRHDGDEAVYVDSNGIKLRILSKSSNMPSVMPKEESKMRKQAAEFSGGKSTPCNKSKPFGSKFLKHMKVKHRGKKLISFNMPRSETEAQPAKDYQAETHKEKEEAMSAVVALNDIRNSGCATLGQWVCSKRSVLRKKMEKEIHKCSENQKISTKRPLLQSNQSDLCDPSGVHSHTNSSRSIGDFRSSPKTKRVYFLQTMSNKKGSPGPHVKEKLSSGSTLTNGLRLQLSTLCHTSRNTRGEHLSSTQKSDNAHQRTARSLDSFHMSMKTKKIASLRKNILVRRPSFPVEEKEKDDTREIAPKALFRKRRSKLVSAKLGGKLPADVNGTSKKEPLEAEGNGTTFTSNSMDKVKEDRISSDSGSHEELTAHPVYDKNGLTSFDVLKEIASLADVQVADEVELKGEGDFQAETVSAKESSACLMSHREVGPDVPLALDVEPSPSPGSTASTISTLLPRVHNSKKDLKAAGGGGRISGNTGEARGREIKLKISPAREPDQLSDSQRCCCSRRRREGLLTEFPSARQSNVPETKMPPRGKQMSSLLLAPQPYSFASYSSLRSQTEPTKLSSNSSVNFPAYGYGWNSTFSPSQTPNSVLRLMGKDLMVLNEGYVRHSNAQPLPSLNPLPSLGFAPPARTVSNQESFWYIRNQLQTGSSICGQASPAAASHGFPLHVGLNAKSVHQPHPKKLNKKTDSPMASARTPYPRDVSSGFRPLYPKLYPRELANPLKSTEGRLRPLLPSPFFLQSTSTGHLSRPINRPRERASL